MLTNLLNDKYTQHINSKIVTRFPPEPNGHLHLGHAKAIYINFNFAKINNGICYLRFDDTNPTKEKNEYINSIIEDVNWLNHTPHKITYTSDYFDQLYNFAIKLIKMDKAYVCELDAHTIKENRYNKIDSIYRNRPIDESLKLFEEMANGQHKEGTMVLRLKCNMQSDNPIMRDLVAYRIIFHEHPRTGNKWVLYPTYDYSHPITDSLENITHSLCSMEFQSRNELYRWLLDTLDIFKSQQTEYTRLTIDDMILSKRKLINFLENKLISGWDDPRILTIKGLKRLGYTPEAINDFCSKIGVGVGLSNGNIKYSLLEECLRQDLDKKVPRIMAVINPIKLILVNGNLNTIFAQKYPNGDKNIGYNIKFNKILYIDAHDFKLNDNPKYFGLTPNKIVRLRYFGLIKYIDHKIDPQNPNIVTEIHAELLQNNNIKTKGVLTWVSDDDYVMVEMRKFKFVNDNNDNNNSDNNNTIEKNNIMVSSDFINYKINDKLQFERIGYFNVDIDSINSNMVVNYITGLRNEVK